LPATAAPSIAISGAWARPATETGGAFLTITNTGAADRLIAAASGVAAHVELHETVKVPTRPMPGMPSMATTATTMRRVSSIAVPARATIILKPGGYHVMLIGLKKPLQAGERIPLRLTFAHAGTVAAIATVRAM
jgi:copper(I)-binding protein